MSTVKLFKSLLILGVLSLLCALAARIVWNRVLGEGPQQFESDLERFKYGSVNSELLAGMPYPLFATLPRVFPDLLAEALGGPSPSEAERLSDRAYEAFGLAWEEGARLPIGLSIKRRGPERVTINCALCHTAVYRLGADDPPSFAVGGPSHSLRFQAFLRFLFAAAKDPRFTASGLLPEMARYEDLDWLDRLLYRGFFIPKTRRVLIELERQLDWMNSRPPWSPGRDDAFNLPKFVLTQSPDDGTVGNTDFPAVWRMANRRGHLIHWGGEAPDLYASVATSAFGIASLPTPGFERRSQWLVDFIEELEPPVHPTVDRTLAAQGSRLFEDRCAQCHGSSGGRLGQSIPVSEIGTDRAHVDTWSQDDADRMNLVTKLAGVSNAELRGSTGYVARPLVGVWLLGPYLHNGSVPTLRDLLSPPEQRPRTFYRGYDLIDLENGGFVASGEAAEAHGVLFDTTLEGNGNGGHTYGVDLPETDKRSLIEYLKTL